MWPHGQETLPDFLQHLNGIYGNIQFTKELEQNGTLPFLDVLVKKKWMAHWTTWYISSFNVVLSKNVIHKFHISKTTSIPTLKHS
jgi:hypothetical protein